MKNFNFFEKLWKHGRTLKRVGLVLVMCLITITQMWAWTGIQLVSDFYGSYSKNAQDFTFGDEANKYWDVYHDGGTHYWRLYLCYFNHDAGPNTSNYVLNVGTTGYKVVNTSTNSFKTTGNAGLIRIQTSQNHDAGSDERPNVWVTRPTVKFKYPWDGSKWELVNATDNQDGTYTYRGTYRGTNYFNAGPNDADKVAKTTTTVNGSPTSGQRCEFKWQPGSGSSGTNYKYTGGEEDNRGVFTITKLLTITYDANGATKGAVPDPQEILYNTSSRLATNSGNLEKVGYKFKGWYTTSTGTGGTHYAAGGSITRTSNITLYAEWEAADAWSIKGAKNSGSGTDYLGNWSKYNYFTYSSEHALVWSVYLGASQTYKFKIIKTASSTDTWYGNTGTISSTTPAQTLADGDWEFTSGGGDEKNCTLTTGSAGTYVFTIDATSSNPRLRVYFPSDAAKAFLTPKKIIYLDGATNTGWKDASYTARFWFKATTDNVQTSPNIQCKYTNDIGVNYRYYVEIPNNEYIDRIQLNRIDPNNDGDDQGFWNGSEVRHAYTRTNAKQNCLILPSKSSDQWSGIPLSWGTYCPPMSSATIAHNDGTNTTAIYGGDGSKSTPYLVATSSSIYMSATSVSLVDDDNMTAYYQFKKTNSNDGGESSTATHTFTANSTHNQTDSMTVVARNYYNSTYGAASPASKAIYYKALTPYSVTTSLTNMTVGSGRTGSGAMLKGEQYVATLVASSGYNLPAAITVTRGAGATDITANCTWDHVAGTLTIPGAQVTDNITITAAGVSCPTGGTVYQFTPQTTSGSTNCSGTPQDITNNSTFLVSITGGKLEAYSATAGHVKKNGTNGLQLANAAGYLILKFSCPLEEGDVVKWTTTSASFYLCTTTTYDSSTDLECAKGTGSATITSAMEGLKTLYIKHSGSNVNIAKFEITRPYTITLSIPDGATCPASSLSGIEGAEVVLPHAFKSGERFLGWYNDPSSGTKQDDHYTISGTTTLYARFGDCLENGTIFSMALDADRAPASTVTAPRAGTMDLLRYADINGGAAWAGNTASGNDYGGVTNAPAIQTNNNAAYVKVQLDCALAAGDTIRVVGLAGNTVWITTGSSRPGSTPASSTIATTSTNYIICDGSTISGKTFYIWRGGGNGTFTGVTVKRPCAPPTIGSQPSSTSICAGSTATLTVGSMSSGSGSGTYTYQWYDASNDSEMSTGSGYNTASFTTPTLNAEASYYCIVSETGGCDSKSSTATVSMKTATSVSFSDYTLDATVDESFEITGISAAGSGTLTYKWYSYTSSDGAGESEIDKATSSTYTFTPASAGDYYFKCQVTGDCGSVKSSMITVTVADAGYEVTYKANNSTAESDVVQTDATFGDNPSFTVPSTKAFTGWNTKADGSGTHYDVGDAVPSAITVYAEWRYKVYYIASSASESNDVTTTLASKYAVSVNATTGTSYNANDYSDYALIVLSESLNGSDAGTDNHELKVIVGLNKPILNLKTYFYGADGDASKRWKWGAPNAGKKPKCIYVKNSTYANLTSHPIYSGLTLDGSDSIQILKAPKTTKPIQPIGSFASGKEGYTLALVPNKSSGSGTAIHEMTAEQRSNATGGTITSKYLMISIQSGELSNLSDNGKKLIKNAADYLITGSQWVPQYAITKSETNGSIATEVSSSAVTSAAAGTLVDITATPTTGYDFSSWSVYKTGDAGTTVSVHSTTTSPTYFTMPAYAVTVAATFVESGYTISFEGNGNTSGAMSDVTAIEEGNNVTLAANGFVKNGYTFANWTADVAVTVNSATVAAGDPIADEATIQSVTSDITLTAQWTPNTYDITYNLNGASWASSAGVAEYTCGTGATLPLAGAMTNTGYTFGGWYDNGGLTGSSVTTIGTSEYGNKEYWAKWTENTYAVTYSANGGTGDAMSNTVGHYVTLSANTYTKSGFVFAGWNTAADGSGASYSEGEEIELKANLDLYAIWATDYTITWDASPKLSGVTAKPNLGGGNYTITASVATWTGSLTTSMISAETSGVTITGVSVDNSASPKTITATFNVGASVVGDKISFTLDVPANGSYSAKSDTEDFDIDRCTGSSSGSDGVLFSAEFKDSGLGTNEICDAANTAYTFTTAELKAAATGGSIKAYTTDNLTHLKYVDNGVYLKGTDAVIRIDLDNAIATNDLFEYVNVHSSNPNAYLRHTSPTTTTDQIVLTGYGSKNVKVMLPAAFNGKTKLYIVKNSTDFKLHKAAIIRPAFLMLLDDSKSAADLSGTDVEMTTSTYLTFIKGGRVYYTSPSSGDLKIKESSSKKYIQFNKSAGYVKIVLTDALQEGDVIGFDSYNTNNLDFTTTAEHTSVITTTNQLYTVNSSSALKGKTTFYIWQHSGSSDNLRGLQIARSGVAGGGGGTDKITTTLTWDTDLSGGVAAETGDADFTHTVTQDKNSLGAITYSSSDATVATVNASGKVHILKAGTTTITATLAASGCYKAAEITYTLNVISSCSDVAGTLTAVDNGCDGVDLTVSGHTGEGVNTTDVKWYKDGVYQNDVAYNNKESITVTAAGDWYAQTTASGVGHCVRNSNAITVTARSAATASAIVEEWYVKNGRRTPDIELVQTANAVGFKVKSGETVIWDTKTSVTTGFAGCSFYIGTNGIIYLMGQQPDGTEPSGLTAGDETLTIIAEGCAGYIDGVDVEIHKQAATTRPSVAFVVDGTKGGDFDEEEENHSVNTELYQFLNYNLSTNPTGKFDLTGQNVYSTVDEQAIREHYSQFDAILITDDPSTDTKIGKKSCVDAFGTMIDVRPILTMEAFVSKWGNWKAKGVDGNPESPNPRQYKMKLQCKDHAIFKDLSVGTNVETETIDGVEYWTVTMVDNTKSPYSGVADGTDTDTKPALQGFSADDVNSLLLLGQISGGSLYAGVERQEETAARLMLLGLNAKALPNALTPEGKKVIENALKYLIETDLEKVDDCSNYFTGKTSTDWNTDSNWSKGHVPHSPNVRVRILSECVINSGTYKVAEVDIATSGKSLNKAGEMTGKLTINAGAALIVGGKIRTAKAPYFNTGDLKPTTEEDLVINTSSTAQAALIFNNDAGDTKATVNLYSLGRKESGHYQFQYYAVPMDYVSVSESFAGSDIYTYVWHEATGWERRGYYTDLYAFEGVGITTKLAAPKTYTMKGALASTATKEITLTKDDDGYNLIGNSWTAPIQISQLEEDNSSLSNQTVYIYNAGNDTTAADGYGTTAGQWTAIPFNAAGFGAWNGLKVIPAMQAFELVPTSEETLTLDYEKVVRGDNKSLTEPLHAPRRVADHAGIELMRIRVADSKTHTDLHLFEGERFSDEFDNGWEAAYMDGDDGTTKLYADVALGRMAVVATDELEGTLLGFAPGKETEYTFSFGGEGMGYYLNDLKLMKSTLINEEATYSFTFEEGDTNRFYISRTPIEAPQTPTGVDNTRSGEVKAQKFIYNDKMYIMINGRVYSAEGQIVK